MRNDEAVITTFALEGRQVRLEPLSLDHVDALALAGAGDRGSFGYTWVPDGRDEAEAYVRGAIDAAPLRGLRGPSARGRRDRRQHAVPRPRGVRDPGAVAAGRGAGIEPSDEHPPSVAEIGSTWYCASAQRTAVNTETKLLLLTHAFEVWDVLRVTLKTDARNAASRAAIERVGGRFEGVRRAHTMATDGTVRDTAYFSIVAAEWSGVRAGLVGRLGS